MDNHSDVRDDPHEVLLILLEIRQRVLITGGQEDLRSGTFAVFLLVVIEELSEKLAALCDQKFV